MQLFGSNSGDLIVTVKSRQAFAAGFRNSSRSIMKQFGVSIRDRTSITTLVPLRLDRATLLRRLRPLLDNLLGQPSAVGNLLF